MIGSLLSEATDGLFFLELADFSGYTGVYSAEGQEALSECYGYDVHFVVPNHSSQPHIARLIDTEVKLTFKNRYAVVDERLVHGIVQWMEWSHEDEEFTHYKARIVPRLWRLTQSSDCRIFQKMTVPDIVKTILKEQGFSAEDYKFIEQENHAEHGYLVQYRETHYEFISRLLAEEGFYFSFKHDPKNHQMVIADTPTLDFAIAGNPIVRYAPPGGGERQEETIQQFRLREQIKTGDYTHKDYSFRQHRSADIRKNQRADKCEDLQRFDYPARYTDEGHGQQLAKYRLEHEQMDVVESHGQSDCVRLQAGLQFILANHGMITCNQKYLVTRITHAAKQPQVLGALSGGEPATYHNTFQCIRSDVPFRAPFDGLKPRISGPQTAIVVGPPGEEIYVDEHGRVKVQFRWDRYGASDEHASCWMRVSQNWGGAGWGGIFIPRIGHEVIVDFLDGDIDQPIITGRVYDATNKSAYKLPEHKTISTIRSQTHKGEGFNELRFEDEANQEEIFIHAQKDQNNVVLNDETTRVGHDRSEKVDNDERINIGNDRTENVQNDENITIGHDQTNTIGNDQRYEIGRNHVTQIGHDQVTNISNARKLDVQTDQIINTGGHHTHEVGGAVILKAGEKIQQLTTLHEIGVDDQAIIQSPGGTIVLDSSGITLKGKVTIQGTLAIVTGGGGGNGFAAEALTAKEMMLNGILRFSE